MSLIRRTILLATAITAAFSLSVASASAATFTPAGDGFRVSSTSVTFSIQLTGGVTRYIICNDVSLAGTLSNPASKKATIPAGSIKFNNAGGAPCTLKINDLVSGTAQFTPTGAGSLNALSTTSVTLGWGAFDIYIVPNANWPKESPCHEAASGAASGIWSNGSQTLTFTKSPGFIGAYGGSLCTGGNQSATATFQVENTTKPGTPITIQP